MPKQATTVGDPANDVLGPDWWRSETVLGTRLCDLVAGFDSIGPFTIPYARLPRRLGTYAEEFSRWADVADQTPQALLSRPKLGAAAVAALIDAAQQAVRIRKATHAAGKVGAEAAVALLVARLNDFDQTILSALVWTLDPMSYRVAAERLGASPISVHRNLPRARARFAELLADPAHQEVNEHANAIRRRLGPYLPTHVADVELRRLGLDPGGRAAQVLLHIAGPYARDGQWVESTAGEVGGHRQARAAVDAVFETTGAPSTSALLQALEDLGMPPGVALTYLEEQEPLRRFGDVWVRWVSETTGDMTEAALHVLGAPATAEAIRATIGADRIRLDTLNGRLSEDDRFVRASRRTWGLRAWGLPEYAGIAHAVGVRIDAGGGQANVDDLVADLLRTIPDIGESSVRTFLDTLEFVINANVVRRRTKADGWPPMPPLNRARGAFRNGENEIRVAIPVASDLLRGSGQRIHSAIATAVGVNPGQRRTFTSPHGHIVLHWKLSSTTGANVGSLRAQAIAVGATAGDTLVLALRQADASLDVARLRAGEDPMAKLSALLGRRVDDPVTALATGLDCQPNEVEMILRRRGDDELADLTREY